MVSGGDTEISVMVSSVAVFQPSAVIFVFVKGARLGCVGRCVCVRVFVCPCVLPKGGKVMSLFCRVPFPFCFFV